MADKKNINNKVNNTGSISKNNNDQFKDDIIVNNIDQIKDEIQNIKKHFNDLYDKLKFIEKTHLQKFLEIDNKVNSTIEHLNFFINTTKNSADLKNNINFKKQGINSNTNMIENNIKSTNIISTDNKYNDKSDLYAKLENIEKNNFQKYSEIDKKVDSTIEYLNSCINTTKNSADKYTSLKKSSEENYMEIKQTISKLNENQNLFKENIVKINNINDELSNFAKNNQTQNLIDETKSIKKNMTELAETFGDGFSHINSQLNIKFQNKGDLLETDFLEERLKNYIGGSKKLNMLFKASENNFSSKSFHNSFKKNKSSYLVMIKTTNDCIFGFYTSKTFNPMYAKNKYIKDKHSFLFTLKVNGIKEFEKFPIDIYDAESAIFTESNIFFALGTGYDLYIPDKCNEKDSCYANFPNSYIVENVCENKKINYFCGGLKSFNIEELELYDVEQCYYQL